MDLDQWVIIYNGRNEADVRQFLHTLSNTCPKIGMGFQQPLCRRIADDRTASFIAAIKETYQGVSV